MGDYSNNVVEELIEKNLKLQSTVNELKVLNTQLLSEKSEETNREYAWSGDLGNWYLNATTKTITYNPVVLIPLGFSNDELVNTVQFESFIQGLQKNEQKKMRAVLTEFLDKEGDYFETEFRLCSKKGNWRWFYIRGKITQRDKQNQPLLLSGIMFDITSRKCKEKKLEHKNKILVRDMMTDYLTGILNRRAIMTVLEKNLYRSEITQKRVSIAILDIDYFKQINDTKGHNYGDYVLIEVSKLLKKNLREKDSVGRYGGEEFIVVLPDTTSSEALTIIDRMRKTVEEFHFKGEEKVTVCGGIKEFDNEILSDFINQADMKLYQAKKAGKNCIMV